MSVPADIPWIRRLRLGARVGLMVGAVLFTLIEGMDALAMLLLPDEHAMLAQLLAWPSVHAKAVALIADTERGYWWIRANSMLLAVLGGLLAMRFARRLSASMVELRAAADRVARGDLVTPVRVAGAREVVDLGRSIDRMRLALAHVMQLARENAGLRKDVALGRAASNLLAPKESDGVGLGQRMLGFHVVTGERAGFWWHGEAPHGRRHIVLGCVDGTGPAAVMSLAALAGAVRDELLHVNDVAPRDLVRRAHALVSTLTPREVGLCIVTVDPERGEGQWAAAGAGDVAFVFHHGSLVRSEGELRTGAVAFADKLGVMMAPDTIAAAAREAIEEALHKTAEPSEAWPDFDALLRGDHMPAALVLLRRELDAERRAA